MGTLPRVHRIPLAEAQVSLPSLIRRLRPGKEYVLLERNGAAVAGLVDPEDFEDYLEIQNPRIKKRIAASMKDYRSGRVLQAEQFLSELKREARKGARR